VFYTQNNPKNPIFQFELCKAQNLAYFCVLHSEWYGTVPDGSLNSRWQIELHPSLKIMAIAMITPMASKHVIQTVNTPSDFSCSPTLKTSLVTFTTPNVGHSMNRAYARPREAHPIPAHKRKACRL
jgi:hypothetical protein